MPRLLFLVSAAKELPLADGRMHTTGYFADEALTPYERFVESGVDVVVATADGTPPFADPYGLEPIFHYPDEDKDFLNGITRTFAADIDDIRLTLRHLTELGLIASRRAFERFKAAGLDAVVARSVVADAARKAWEGDLMFVDVLSEAALPVGVHRGELEEDLAAVIHDSEVESNRVRDALNSLPGFVAPESLAAMSDDTMGSFDAVFVPGGHGPMVDLSENPDVERLLGILHNKDATIASLCHGPAFLLSAPAGPDGTWLFDGFRVTAFTDEEESQTPPGKEGMAWLLESALRNAGAVFDDGRSAWSSHVVVDRNLITAQNPGSADAVSDAVLKSIGVL